MMIFQTMMLVYTKFVLKLVKQAGMHLENNQDEEMGIANYNTNLVMTFIKKAKITSIALAAIWLMFAVEAIMALNLIKIDSMVLWRLGGNIPSLVQEGQIYRLVMPLVLHGGALHILMNTLSLIGFCAVVEQQHSLRLYLTVYILGGVQGNMLTDFYNLKFGNPNIVGIGASTSICAVMGLYMANIICLAKKHQDVGRSKQEAIRMLFSLLIISLFPGVDFFGHAGSLMSGVLLGMTLIPGQDKQLSSVKWAGRLLWLLYTILLFTIFI